jgi:uncharacterized repeat protein (TIGR03803 family)
MRKVPKKFLLLSLLITSVVAQRASAQMLTMIYNFTGTNDGGDLKCGVAVSGTRVYGTAYDGGAWAVPGSNAGYGTVFGVNIDRSGFTVLHNFTPAPYYTNTDGAHPNGTLVLGSNILYGTTSLGGTSGNGVVFAVQTDGSGFTNLHSFAGFSAADGSSPFAGLILSSNVLYGTTTSGGDYNGGTVFSINTDGTGYRKLHSFGGNGTDGGTLYAPLILSGNTLYGTARDSGVSGYGTVFAVNTDGTAFKVLHSFAEDTNGVSPTGKLALSGNVLYGTTSGWVTPSYNGTIFAVKTDGTGFMTLHTFTGGDDGRNPAAGMIVSGGTVYGTAEFGGGSGFGTLFAIKTDGTSFSVLHSFAGGPSDGSEPLADLMFSEDTLYGTTSFGGSSWSGTVFSLSLPMPPRLTISPMGQTVILTWPTNATGFTLQSTTTLDPSAIWTTNLPSPVVVNGQNTVTNPITGTQQFYRLSQ